jgi:hypothetical protein
MAESHNHNGRAYHEERAKPASSLFAAGLVCISLKQVAKTVLALCLGGWMLRK